MASEERILILTSPIEAYGEKLSQLVLRRPTVKELRASGQPYRVSGASGNASVGADYEACAKLIAAICAIPPSSVDEMDGADFDEAAMILAGFTMPRPRPSASKA